MHACACDTSELPPPLAILRHSLACYGLRVDSTFQAALRIVSRATPELAIVREIMEVRPVVAMFLMSVSLMVDDDA